MTVTTVDAEENSIERYYDTSLTVFAVSIRIKCMLRSTDVYNSV